MTIVPIRGTYNVHFARGNMSMNGQSLAILSDKYEIFPIYELELRFLEIILLYKFGHYFGNFFQNERDDPGYRRGRIYR